MPIVYETKTNYNGQEYCSGNIAYTYRNYYGPNKPYTEYDSFSMNIDKEDLELFIKETNASISDESIEITNNAITLNYVKEMNQVLLTEPGNFLHKEICFQQDFKKYINN